MYIYPTDFKFQSTYDMTYNLFNVSSLVIPVLGFTSMCFHHLFFDEEEILKVWFAAIDLSTLILLFCFFYLMIWNCLNELLLFG